LGLKIDHLATLPLGRLSKAILVAQCGANADVNHFRFSNLLLTAESQLSEEDNQGDQIRRIFARYVLVYFGQFLKKIKKKLRSRPNFEVLFA
jgi:hypothetical protein